MSEVDSSKKPINLKKTTKLMIMKGQKTINSIKFSGSNLFLVFSLEFYVEF